MADITKANLNTILLAITLGVCSWVGYTVHTSATDIAAMRVNIETLRAADTQRVADLTELRTRVTQCEIELARLKQFAPAK